MQAMFSYMAQKQTALCKLSVKAGAKANKIVGFIVINDEYCLKLSVVEAPENGKANRAIINFLSKEWRLTKSNLEIIKGHNNSLKILAIKNITLDYLNSIFDDYIC
jgi:uncharacterized protein